MASSATSMVSCSKECGCKGIRTCLLCRNPTNNVLENQDPVVVQRCVYQYCIHCDKAWQNTSSSESMELKATSAALGDDVLKAKPCCHDGETVTDLLGIHITQDFVTQEEEDELDKTISCTPFMKSQSGRQKQDFGPKVNFKRQKLNLGSFNGLPSYSQFLYQRMKACDRLKDFEPVEMCNLEYAADRGAHIDPHFDDSWIWGERLVTLNLLSDSVLSFTNDLHPNVVIRVPLLRRSLIVVSGPARYEWKHGIDSEHIFGQRIAITFRELADEFKTGGVRCDEGQELLKLALSFEGCAVGCA